MQGNLEISGAEVSLTSFSDHSAQHENGGSDEISVAGLSGLLADGQTPLSHNHTSVAGQGGVLTADEHDSYAQYAGTSAPSAPAAGFARFYAKTTQGHTHLHFMDEDGTDYGINHDLILLVKNTSGLSIAKGQFVDINGSSGQTPTVQLADADAFDGTHPRHAEGITLEVIANNGFGMILTSGEITGIDTSSVSAEGVVVFLATTAGAFTETAPTTAGAFQQQLGVVTNKHLTQGSIAVTIDGSVRKLDDLPAPDDTTDLNATTSAHGLMPKGGNDTTKFYRGDVTQAVPDHGSIGGLADDDHTQYALLAGRSTGQTLKGGTGASEALTLSSTNHATKGVVTLADEVLSRAELRDHMESKATGTISAGAITVDYTAAAVFAVSLNAAITSFTISNPSPTGTHCAVTFIFTADGTVRAITWPTGTVWPAGTAPTMTGTLNKRDVITLFTFDGGTIWYGVVVGQNY